MFVERLLALRAYCILEAPLDVADFSRPSTRPTFWDCA